MCVVTTRPKCLIYCIVDAHRNTEYDMVVPGAANRIAVARIYLSDRCPTRGREGVLHGAALPPLSLFALTTPTSFPIISANNNRIRSLRSFAVPLQRSWKWGMGKEAKASHRCTMRKEAIFCSWQCPGPDSRLMHRKCGAYDPRILELRWDVTHSVYSQPSDPPTPQHSRIDAHAQIKSSDATKTAPCDNT